MRGPTRFAFGPPASPPVVDARLKPLPGGKWKVLCGHTPCPGPLGTLLPTEDPDLPIGLEDTWVPQVAAHAGEDLPQKWHLAHDDGYQRLEDGSYAILKDKRPAVYGRKVGFREGRRPLPFAGLEHPRREIVGRFPQPGDLIRCCHCGWRNAVPVPPRGV